MSNSAMRHLEVKDLSTPEIHAYLLGGVAPRPIALVSTISKSGINNLSPFSFFNAFGANPPTVAFSPARRARDGSFKHTYLNLMESKECVIQCVTHAMVEQVSLSSTEYDEGVDEFVKSGLTPVAADLVKPKRVKESPFQMECILKQMIPLGDGKGSGNLAICEVVKFHLAESILREGKIHPDQIDLVARMGGNFYARASGTAVFEVEKPLAKQGIGIDQLPEFIRNSQVYNGNNLGRLGNSENMPTPDEVMEFVDAQTPLNHVSEDLFQDYLQKKDHLSLFRSALAFQNIKHPKSQFFLEQAAKCAIENQSMTEAWCMALYAGMKR